MNDKKFFTSVELFTEATEIVESILSGKYNPEDPIFAAAMYLVVGHWVGYHAIRIHQISGLPRNKCVWMGIQLRSRGIIRSGHITTNWFAENGEGFLQFLLDAMVAVGQIDRRTHGVHSGCYFINR